ncbi:MAG: HAMP domain-containing protein [Proteobacteria bacterium]|nr:HAMP domain-containing protein [Pseudomonadota bacterium]MBU1231287.1 HAMP domain-containing protein [Pseudomonadota bacterium]MBU1417787.1 HAMP domain-containing protein [Pseudomonadota bacterium]MBU1453663.1 HAMP domain-containing protein [Pseudomonadota bacterium]
MTVATQHSHGQNESLPTFSFKAGSLPIAVKLALIITTVIIVGMGLLSLFILGNQSTVFDQQTDAYASALGDQLSTAAIEPVLAGDLQAIDQLTSNLVDNEGIEGVAIFSDQSKMLSSIGINPEQAPPLILPEQPLYWHIGETNKIGLTSYVREITFRDLTVGYCLITFDRSFMNTAYGNTIRTISAITALMVLLGIIVAAFLSKQLSRPIKHLVEGSQEISRGNYRYRFQERRQDELGQLMGSLNTMTEGLLRKEQVEQTFSRYVSPNVACALMNNLEKIHLGGSHVEATVLFADISGFTTLSEGLEPTAINSLLNEYFTLIDQIAGKHGGHIDKYIGDCAMILFGVPLHDKEHGINGVSCGVEIQQVIKEYNLTRKKQRKITVEFSIGINSGTMLAGNMGSERRMEYTVVGNAVNLASRLSSIATAGEVIVTRELHDTLGLAALFETYQSGTIELRGKTTPVEVWHIGHQLRMISSPELFDIHTPSIVH